ncbi:hypothetical protein V1289_002472 [Bradyrhizobium sp. AZCC 2289]
MMYDHEKSDPAIVAGKPTNKAGQPAAELVEPRAGAEGNVSQQSTGRAQYRGTVSQALKRIRNFVRISRRAVRHPRWEPYARIGPVRICAGARGNSRPYRESRAAGPSGQLLTHFRPKPPRDIKGGWSNE